MEHILVLLDGKFVLNPYKFIFGLFLCEMDQFDHSTIYTIVLTAARENVSSCLCGQPRPRSDSGDAQSDQDLHSQLT